MPLITPSSVPSRRRSHVIFGAAKYGSSGRPVISVRRSACSASSFVTVTARRSCQLSAGPNGRPVERSQRSTVSPWLPTPPASTGSPMAARAPGRPPARPPPPPRRNDRVEQLLRVLLDGAARPGPRADRGGALAEHPAAVG